jgi:hypothetical protein
LRVRSVNSFQIGGNRAGRCVFVGGVGVARCLIVGVDARIVVRHSILDHVVCGLVVSRHDTLPFG